MKWLSLRSVWSDNQFEVHLVGFNNGKDMSKTAHLWSIMCEFNLRYKTKVPNNSARDEVVLITIQCSNWSKVKWVSCWCYAVLIDKQTRLILNLFQSLKNMNIMDMDGNGWWKFYANFNIINISNNVTMLKMYSVVLLY